MMKKLLESYYAQDGRCWDYDILVVAAVKWSPPKIKPRKDWNSNTINVFYKIGYNCIERDACLYSNETLE